MIRSASYIFITLILLGTELFGQNAVSGNIITHVDSIINAMPSGTGNNDYVEADFSARNTWRTVIQNIFSGDYSAAHTAAAAITYQVVEFTDTTTTYYTFSQHL